MEEERLKSEQEPLSIRDGEAAGWRRGAQLTSSLAATLLAAGSSKRALAEGSAIQYYNARNERIYDTARKSYLPASLAAENLSKELKGQRRRVVVMGEVHSNPVHHHAELEVLKAMVCEPDIHTYTHTHTYSHSRILTLTHTLPGIPMRGG